MNAPRCATCGFMIVKDSKDRWVRFLINGPQIPPVQCANGGAHIPEEQK